MSKIKRCYFDILWYYRIFGSSPDANVAEWTWWLFLRHPQRPDRHSICMPELCKEAAEVPLRHWKKVFN